MLISKGRKISLIQFFNLNCATKQAIELIIEARSLTILQERHHDIAAAAIT